MLIPNLISFLESAKLLRVHFYFRQTIAIESDRFLAYDRYNGFCKKNIFKKWFKFF